MNKLEIKYYSHLCACGCNGKIQVRKRHKYFGIPIYIVGHNNKINPNFLGKKHTEKAKKANSEKHKGKIGWNKGLTKETSTAVKKISEAKEGIKNPMYGKKWNHTEESIQLMSEKAVIKIIKNGIGNYRGRKGFFYSNKNKKDIFYASSYEKRALGIFEEDNNIIFYERCKFYIPYFIMNEYGFFGERKRRYVPDFTVYYKNGNKEIIEIKPTKFFGTAQNLSKFLFLEEFCKENKYDFNIWTEKDLQLKGVV